MHTLEYYLNKGLDQKTAEYFASGRKKILSVVPCDDKKLILTFDNGETKILDIAPLIQPGTVFAFLENSGSFNRVYLDETACVSWDIDPNIDSTKEWNNKVDLSPDMCYMDSVPIEVQQ